MFTVDIQMMGLWWFSFLSVGLSVLSDFTSSICTQKNHKKKHYYNHLSHLKLAQRD